MSLDILLGISHLAVFAFFLPSGLPQLHDKRTTPLVVKIAAAEEVLFFVAPTVNLGRVQCKTHDEPIVSIRDEFMRVSYRALTCPCGFYGLANT